MERFAIGTPWFTNIYLFIEFVNQMNLLLLLAINISLFLPQLPAGEYHQEGSRSYAADFLEVGAVFQSFDCSQDNIGLHLKNVYGSGELEKNRTAEEISVVQKEGARSVKRNVSFYNLDAIISAG